EQSSEVWLVLQGIGLDGQVSYPTQKYSFQIEDSAVELRGIKPSRRIKYSHLPLILFINNDSSY
ncbi:MAG: hypothetical protein PQJ46_04585, partial [Spirochaetales bacterium]|nr:hypothetical protein [Spirochaetales bacterium]